MKNKTVKIYLQIALHKSSLVVNENDRRHLDLAEKIHFEVGHEPSNKIHNRIERL